MKPAKRDEKIPISKGGPKNKTSRVVGETKRDSGRREGKKRGFVEKFSSRFPGGRGVKRSERSCGKGGGGHTEKSVHQNNLLREGPSSIRNSALADR